MLQEDKIRTALKFLKPQLLEEIVSNAIVKEVPKNTEILREGQFVKVIPLILEGLVKVFTRGKDEKELLLYYIQSQESCVMSFAAGLKNHPSKVYAQTENDSLILLLPVQKVNQWIIQFPQLNTLFFQQYNLRYVDLLETIHHLIFEKLDTRLFNYLKEKTTLTKSNPIKLSHKQIANDLGTAREVVSRIMKKLENEEVIEQSSTGIKIL